MEWLIAAGGAFAILGALLDWDWFMGHRCALPQPRVVQQALWSLPRLLEIAAFGRRARGLAVSYRPMASPSRCRLRSGKIQP